MERFRKAQRLRASQTTAEAKLWRELRGRRLSRWKFRRQHPIDRYIADFASIEGKLVVEVDGDTHYSDVAILRDAARTKAIEACGFLVLRVSNIDVRENIDGVLALIDRTLSAK